MTNRLRLLLTILAVLLAFLAGWWLRGRSATARAAAEKTLQIRSGRNSLVNPLLDCEQAKDTVGDMGIIPFRAKIQRLVEEKTRQYQLTYVSVYFRELNDGTWFGINEQEHFAPASLLKVPLMITWLKQAESSPGLLSRTIVFDTAQGEDYNQLLTVRPSHSIVPGREYTVEELIRMMIVYSDNNANTLLFRKTDQRLLMKTYRELGVEPPLNSKSIDYMSVKEYGGIFKVLFNTSYLNREMSTKALQYLSEVEFRAGLVAGVPADVPVAHKFGERVLGEQGDTKQLHDCGIIYHPQNPYLLCIMTRGTDFATLDDIIRDISRLTFGEVELQQKSR